MIHCKICGKRVKEDLESHMKTDHNWTEGQCLSGWYKR